MKMLGDYELFIQLCEKRGISAPREILDAIKIGSSNGELRFPCMSIVVPICGILARMLVSSTTIKTVDFSDCMLQSKGLSSILHALCEGSNITTLNLKGNNINGPIVGELGKIFYHNNTLKRLSMEWNSLGSDNDAFFKFCEGLSSNHNIEELDLRYNQISPDCAESLAKALRENKSLKTIDLSWNILGIRGGQLLLNGIRENRSITKMNLRGNCIPDEIVQTIEDCVYKNQCRIAVSQMKVSETVETAKTIMLNENFENSSNKLISDNLLINEPIKMTMNFAPNESEFDNSTILTTKIVGDNCGDIDANDKNNGKVAEVKNKIAELNYILKDRTAAIDLLTKEIGVRAEETNDAKTLINQLENEIRQLKEEREKLILEKCQEIEELKEIERKTEDRWQREYKKLEDSFKESSIREKELETRVQRYEREFRKNSIEIANLKEKSILQTRSYEDLIAKSRIEIHRVKRETKERDNRYKIELNVLKNNLKESNDSYEESQTQLQRNRVELREATENLSSVKTRLTEVERVNCRLVRIEESFQKLKDEKKSLEEKLHDSQRSIAILQRQVATLQGELIEPQRRYSLVKDELEQEREKTVRLKRELSEERTRLQEQNVQLQTLNSQITALNNQINDIQNNHVEALRERDKERKILKEIISNKERDINELKTEEVQRASQLYAAFSKYIASSIGPNTTL